MLLAAGQYAILEHYLQGEELERAVAIGASVMSNFKFPSCVFNRDFNIYDWNPAFVRLFNLPEEQFKKERPENRNIVRYVFDEDAPTYRLLRTSNEAWEYAATLVVLWFKSDNIYFRGEDWYDNKQQSFRKYRGFGRIWDNVDLDYRPPKDVAQKLDFPQHILELPTPQGQTLRVHAGQMKYLDIEYPRILTYVPEDQTTRRAFGLP